MLRPVNNRTLMRSNDIYNFQKPLESDTMNYCSLQPVENNNNNNKEIDELLLKYNNLQKQTNIIRGKLEQLGFNFS